MLIIFLTGPQLLLLLSIGPVWTTLPTNPVQHQVVQVMSPFFVINTEWV